MTGPHSWWRVLAGLAVIGLGVTMLVAPSLVAGVLPILLFAAFLLALLFMTRGMTIGSQRAAQGHAGMARSSTCCRHPATRSTQPGRCPHCGRNLVPAAPRDDQLARPQAQLQRSDGPQTTPMRQIEQVEADGESAPSVESPR